MCDYTFDYHKQKYKAYDTKVRLLRFESGLAIANNYYRCDRKSLLHAYYTFINIHGSKLPRMKTLESKVQDDYAVITCRIPRWRCKEFERMMGSLKDRAYEERRFDYLDICEAAVPQFA